MTKNVTTAIFRNGDLVHFSLRLSQAWVQNLTIKMGSRRDELCGCVSSGTACAFIYFFLHVAKSLIRVKPLLNIGEFILRRNHTNVKNVATPPPFFFNWRIVALQCCVGFC